MNSTIFWDITPCSLLRVSRRFGRTYRLHVQGRKINRARNQRESRWQAELVSCLAYFLTLKMEAICSSETSVGSQWTTRRYIPEDGTIHNHRIENLKSYNVKLMSKIINDIWNMHWKKHRQETNQLYCHKWDGFGACSIFDFTRQGLWVVQYLFWQK
jgi:hypothetical protein